jgi:predicted PurR-regulated permease PerM
MSQSLPDPHATSTEAKSVPPRRTTLRRYRFFALNALFVMAVFYTIYFMRSLLLPLVLALLLSYLLIPLVRGLARMKIPTLVGAAIVVGGLLALLGIGISQLGEPAASWMAKAPYSLHLVKERIRPLQEPIKKVQEASKQLDSLTESEESEGEPVVKVKESKNALDFLLSQTPAFLASALYTVILLYFMLAYSGTILNKIVRIAPRLTDKKHAVGIAREVEQAISRYLLTVTAINLALGVTIAFAMWWLGLPNPILWGALAAILNFVPYIGGIVGIAAMTLAALLSHDTIGQAVVFPLTYLAINTLEGSFITPTIMGRSFTLNPIVVIVGLLFWGWLWGIPGMILAVPILVAFKIVCDHVPALRPMADFLSQ